MLHGSSKGVNEYDKIIRILQQIPNSCKYPLKMPYIRKQHYLSYAFVWGGENARFYKSTIEVGTIIKEIDLREEIFNEF
jgi:hypothetical protein